MSSTGRHFTGIPTQGRKPELLQTEDVATSKETIWGNLELSGRWFVNFLDASIRYYLAQKWKADTLAVQGARGVVPFSLPLLWLRPLESKVNHKPTSLTPASSPSWQATEHW